MTLDFNLTERNKLGKRDIYLQQRRQKTWQLRTTHNSNTSYPVKTVNRLVLTILDSCISHLKTNLPSAVHFGLLFVFLAGVARNCPPFPHKSWKLYANEVLLIKIQKIIRPAPSLKKYWQSTNIEGYSFGSGLFLSKIQISTFATSKVRKKVLRGTDIVPILSQLPSLDRVG